MSRHPHDAVYGGGQPLPVLGLFRKLLAPKRRQTIEPGAASQPGDAPFGLDPALMVQTMKRGIKRALIHLQDVLRNLLDALGDVPAVFGAVVLKRSQDEKIQSTLKKIDPV